MALQSFITFPIALVYVCVSFEANPVKRLYPTTKIARGQNGHAFQMSWMSTDDLTYAFIRVGKFGSDDQIGYMFYKDSNVGTFQSSYQSNKTHPISFDGITATLEGDNKQITLAFKKLNEKYSGNYSAEVKWEATNSYISAEIKLDVEGCSCRPIDSSSVWMPLFIISLVLNIALFAYIIRIKRTSGQSYTIINDEETTQEQDYEELRDLHSPLPPKKQENTGQARKRKRRGRRYRTL